MLLKYRRMIICCLGSLAGAICVASLALPALAGENIIFSAPPKALALPMVERQEKGDAPPASVSLGSFSPSVDPGMGLEPSMSVILLRGRSRNARNSDRNSLVRNNLGLDRNNLDHGADPDLDQDPDQAVNGDGMNGRADFNPAYDKNGGPNDMSRSSQFLSAQRGFVGVTNRWDLERSWSSSSSKDSTGTRRAGYDTEKDRALRSSGLGAWAVRSGSDGQSEDEDADSTANKNGSGIFHSSLFSRAFGSRSYWDKAKGGEADRFKLDANKSGLRWSDGTGQAQSTGFGSADWFEHDAGAGAGSTAGMAEAGFVRPLQGAEPKAEDPLAGVAKDASAFQMPELNSPGYSDSLPKQDFIPPTPTLAPEAPVVLPFPKMPGSVFR